MVVRALLHRFALPNGINPVCSYCCGMVVLARIHPYPRAWAMQRCYLQREPYWHHRFAPVLESCYEKATWPGKGYYCAAVERTVLPCDLGCGCGCYGSLER